MENTVTITNAKYIKIFDEDAAIGANINGVFISVPIYPGNKEYDEIMRQVENGTITIAPADE